MKHKIGFRNMVLPASLIAIVARSGCTVTTSPLSDRISEFDQHPICRDIETGVEMELSEAWQRAAESSCVDEAELKGTYVCNENTGTWWLDLEALRAGCSPACVVDVNTGDAEINWRCTGLLPE